MLSLKCMKKILLGIILSLVGCASGGRDGGEENKMPYGDEASQARSEAFSGDISIRKDMPKRDAKFKPFDFYYKRCSLNNNETHYSRTSYDCNMPGF